MMWALKYRGWGREGGGLPGYETEWIMVLFSWRGLRGDQICDFVVAGRVIEGRRGCYKVMSLDRTFKVWNRTQMWRMLNLQWHTQILGSEKWPGLEMHIWESSGNLTSIHLQRRENKLRREASQGLSLEELPLKCWLHRVAHIGGEWKENSCNNMNQTGERDLISRHPKQWRDTVTRSLALTHFEGTQLSCTQLFCQSLHQDELSNRSQWQRKMKGKCGEDCVGGTHS